MGIEFLKYLLAVSRVSIDRHAAENLQTSRLFNIHIELGEQREHRESQEINKYSQEVLVFIHVSVLMRVRQCVKSVSVPTFVFSS